MGPPTGDLQSLPDMGTFGEERPQRFLEESDSSGQKRRINSELGGDRHIGTSPPQEGGEFSLGQAEPVHRGDIEMPYPGVIDGIQDRSPGAALRNPKEARATKTDRGGRSEERRVGRG